MKHIHSFDSFLAEGLKYNELSKMADEIYKENEKELVKLGKTSEPEEAEETADTMAENNISSYIESKKVDLSEKDRTTLLKILRQNYYYTLLDEDGEEE